MEEYDLGTGIQVITIVLDESKDTPEVFLDDVPISTAIVLFKEAAKTLEETLPGMRIHDKDGLIADSVYISFGTWDDDEDDDEDW